MARKTKKQTRSAPVAAGAGPSKLSVGQSAQPAADPRLTNRRVVGLLGLLAVIAVAVWFAWPALAPLVAQREAPGQPAAPAAFVGSQACAGCHQAEHTAWQGSQHARAMQHATEATVLGDFNDARHVHDGVTSTFFRRDGRFFVRTDGPDGRLADFEVKYTFGVAPLQQYLVELPGGRLQALSVTWDTRPAADGGQRWFRQYPGEKIDFRDELHWTRRSQNWNFMCADCHSTDIRKGHEAATGTFSTRWAEISVGCESCHGPGSRHIAWTKARPASDPSRGLTARLDERRGASWHIDAVSGNAARKPALASGREIEVCAACHSRRAQLAEGHRAGDPLLDRYLPSTLAEGLYHADGQQRDEVFTWGSFVQSRMHRAGVTCSDCHDPHTQKLRAPGNATCGQCHAANKYDSLAHHFHEPASPSGQCVNCHMPATTYMVVDPRRDHSFRVPRPDLSVDIGTPNACSGCHADKPPKWSADAVLKWYGASRSQRPHYGVAIDAGRRGKPGAASGLIAIASDIGQPAIVRATAIELLRRYPGRAADELTRKALKDADPLVRHSALVAQEALAPGDRLALLAPMLGDPLRVVRMEAARLLAPVAAQMNPQTAAAMSAALAELESAQRENLSEPGTWINAGNLQAARGQPAQAEEAFRTAIRLAPDFVPAYVNLADLARAAGRDRDAERLLREGLARVPGAPALRESRGRALVRRGRKPEALAEFAAAYKAAPGEERYVYLYALSLDDAGRRREAIAVLSAHAALSGGRDVLLALASLRRQAGDIEGAGEALRMLSAINPHDPELARLKGRP